MMYQVSLAAATSWKHLESSNHIGLNVMGHARGSAAGRSEAGPALADIIGYYLAWDT